MNSQVPEPTTGGEIRKFHQWGAGELRIFPLAHWRDRGGESFWCPRSLAFARIATSSASGRSRILPSLSSVVGKLLAWITRRGQSGLGRRRGTLNFAAVPTDPEVVRGAEREMPLVTATANLRL